MVANVTVPSEELILFHRVAVVVLQLTYGQNDVYKVCYKQSAALLRNLFMIIQVVRECGGTLYVGMPRKQMAAHTMQCD